MGLILIPFYFFSAVGLFLLLTLISRVLRLQVAANTLAVSAVILGIAVVAVPLLTDFLDLAHYGGRYLLALGALTFVLATLDAILETVLPLPLDRELENF